MVPWFGARESKALGKIWGMVRSNRNRGGVVKEEGEEPTEIYFKKNYFELSGGGARL